MSLGFFKDQKKYKIIHYFCILNFIFTNYLFHNPGYVSFLCRVRLKKELTKLFLNHSKVGAYGNYFPLVANINPPKHLIFPFSFIFHILTLKMAASEGTSHTVLF